VNPHPAAPDTAQSHRWHRAPDYEQLTGRLQLRNAVLLSRLHPDPAAVLRAYEIGCGTGALTALLVDALPRASIDAVDVSAQMLAVARAKPWPDRVRFVHDAFPDVDPAGGYDAVFSNAALHWTYPRYPEVFAAARRLLHSGGRFCAATAGRTRSTEEFGRFLADRLAAVAGDDVPDPFDRRRLGVDDVLGLAGVAGFDVEDAFLVERSATVQADGYARWWVASGPPWLADQVPPADAIELITRALGGPGTPVTVPHASVVMLLRLPTGSSGGNRYAPAPSAGRWADA
jgi:SAM-dependent methyltransferase